MKKANYVERLYNRIIEGEIFTSSIKEKVSFKFVEWERSGLRISESHLARS